MRDRHLLSRGADVLNALDASFSASTGLPPARPITLSMMLGAVWILRRPSPDNSWGADGARPVASVSQRLTAHAVSGSLQRTGLGRERAPDNPTLAG
jgi:hypothetical protein